MFTKRLFHISLLGVALFTLLALVGHHAEPRVAVATSAPVSGKPLDSPLPTPFYECPK